MKTQLVHFPTPDGLMLDGLLYKPAQPTKTVVIHVSGMSDSCTMNRVVETMKVDYADNAIALLNFNHRGHDIMSYIPKIAGGRIVGGVAQEVFEECEYDIQAAINFVKSQGYSNIILQGHSLGAVKIAYFQGKTKSIDVKMLVLLSFADMVELGKDDEAYERNMKRAKELVAEGKGDIILPEKVWGEHILSAKTYLNLFTAGNAVDVFNLSQMDVPSPMLSDITIPVIAVMGEIDDVYIHGDELERTKKKLVNAAQVVTLTIPGANHEYKGVEKEASRTIVQAVKNLL